MNNNIYAKVLTQRSSKITTIWNTKKKIWMTCEFNVDNINKLMNNKNIDTLVHKKNELLKNPEIKLINEIKNMESNKMIFPKW